MPRAYPAEFRARAIALVRAGKEQKQTAVDLGIHPVTLSKWLRQDDIDNGRRPDRVSATTVVRAAIATAMPEVLVRQLSQTVWGSCASVRT
nr:transposase [Streptomyces alanosinicus]